MKRIFTVENLMFWLGITIAVTCVAALLMGCKQQEIISKNQQPLTINVRLNAIDSTTGYQTTDKVLTVTIK